MVDSYFRHEAHPVYSLRLHVTFELTVVKKTVKVQVCGQRLAVTVNTQKRQEYAEI